MATNVDDPGVEVLIGDTLTGLKERREELSVRRQTLMTEAQRCAAGVKRIDRIFKAAGVQVSPNGTKKKRTRGGNRNNPEAVESVYKLLASMKEPASSGEIAKKLKIHPTYVGRILGQLRGEGRVRKAGTRPATKTGQHPTPIWAVMPGGK